MTDYPFLYYFFVLRFPILTLYMFYVCLQQDCPNGRLTPAKFVDMYKMFFPSGNAVEFCDHVFRTFDMDKNGYIDFKVTFIVNFSTSIFLIFLQCEFYSVQMF